MTEAAVAEAETEETKTYEFDEGFQQKLTSLILRDQEFNSKVDGLVDPSYFTNHVDGIIVRIAQDYYNKYRFCPSKGILKTLIQEAKDSKLVREDDVSDIKTRLVECYRDDLSDKEFIAERVGDFARRAALEAAIFKAADLLDKGKGKYDGIEEAIKRALSVGLNEETNRYDFWGNNDSRAEYREEVAAGRIKPTGITTGFREVDDLLYHKGWGRKELTCLMGPAKSGKSMSLIGFALAASMAGYNVCYVTLEVAARIIADRSDANLGNTSMGNLTSAIGLIKSRVAAKKAAGAGAMDIFDYPTGTLSPTDLRRLITQRQAAGTNYDLIVVDYADLMRPDSVSSESRENSKQVYVGLRQVSYEFNAAVLTATQTNREGFKAVAGKMEHVSEDINKARTVDLLISLNASEEERLRGEARIYFAASRNQKSDITIRVKSDIEKAKYIASILGIDK